MVHFIAKLKKKNNFRKTCLWMDMVTLNCDVRKFDSLGQEPFVRRNSLARVLSRIYQLGEKFLFFEMNMRWDEIWCILRHNLVISVSLEGNTYFMCTDLVASGWFFRHSHLYTVKITIYIFFLGGGGGSWEFFLGGSFYPSDTQDKTLNLVQFWQGF